MMAAKIVDVEDLDIKNRTDKAILVDDGKVSVWLPLSQVEVEEYRDGTYTVTLPEWLAKDKGLI
jgi:hypothetical protein